MGGSKREPTTKYVDFAVSVGYKIIRETSDRRRVQLRHKRTGALITLPLYASGATGKEWRNNHLTLIRRGARKGRVQ
jgi:hypothetical protein